jgi:S1-C subfamily serine protease
MSPHATALLLLAAIAAPLPFTAAAEPAAWVAAGAVLAVASEDDDQPGGSAVVVAPGRILALQESFPHSVAAGATVTLVLPGGRRRTATVERVGAGTAVLLSGDTTGLNPLLAADPHRLSIGSPVWTLGNTTGALADDGQPAVSQGIVSGRYDLPADGPVVRGRRGKVLSGYSGPVLELDAAVNDGCQGGAVLDAGGHLVGLASLATARERRLGTAIPIDVLFAGLDLPAPTLAASAAEVPAPPPGLALIAFDRPNGLGNPEAVPRPPKALDQVPAYDRERLERWWDAYYHQQQVLWTDSPSPALVIDPQQGLLLTAASHLHGDATTGRVLLGARSIPCSVVASDLPLDLVLLRATEALPLPAAVIVPVEPAAGAAVAVIAPFRPDGLPTRTAGHVSCVGRRLDPANVSYLQIDARANFASLGGAVVDENGRIVGMVVRADPESPWKINSGVTLAIDGATIAKALPELQAGTSRRHLRRLGLGVVLRNADDLLAIAKVVPGTGAAQAGLQAGDLLVSIDGKPSASIPAVTRALMRHRAGDRVRVEVRRGGRPLACDLELREFGE